ncbi:MAG: LysR substrate-binding domain-containing protein, partial [Burkholderiales bacterium]
THILAGRFFMYLDQLETVYAIARTRYSISTAAETLGKSQSALSRQVKELELELGVQIFVRTRNKVMGLTLDGEKVLAIALRMRNAMKELQEIRTGGSQQAPGELRIATTHVYARYLLPAAIKRFSERFPAVSLALQQSDPVQCRAIIAAGDADIGIVTTTEQAFDSVVTIPIYKLPRCVIVPAGHPLTLMKKLTLAQLAKHAIIAYPASFSGRSIVMQQFAAAGLTPRIVCSGTDADVCKAYVEIGMGVAVLARAAFDESRDRRLVALRADHLFPPGILTLVFRKNGYINPGTEAFLNIIAPHIKPGLVLRAMKGAQIDRDELIRNAPLYE